MAEDDQDRAREREAEREAEMEEEMKRVGEDPDQVQDGESDLGSQSAPSGEVREAETTHEQAGDGTETMQEDAQELPNEQQREQWEESGGDEELAEEATGVEVTVPEDGLDEDDVGKAVVDEEGTELGIVAQASREGGAVHVDVDPGVAERILSTLGWTGEGDVDYTIPRERISRVTDDRVVLKSGDVDTAVE